MIQPGPGRFPSSPPSTAARGPSCYDTTTSTFQSGGHQSR